MHIFVQELKSYRKSMFVWAISLSLLVIVFLLMFSGFTKDVESSQKVISSFPEAVRVALGISLKNFFTIYGFFAYLFSFAALAGAIQAMNLGVGVISKEISGKTADFLLTKPVSRIKIVTSKLLSVIFIIAFTNLIFSLTASIMAKLVTAGKSDNGIILLISGSMFLIQMFFVGLGILFSVVIPKIKSVIAVSLPTVFTFYIIGTLGAIVGNDNVKYLSPFKFYDSNYIINNCSYDVRFIIFETLFLVVTLVSSYIIFINKDIRAVS